MSDFSFTEVDDKSNEILAAATNLHPENPTILQSKSLEKYFKDCGMTDDLIIPSGLQDYTGAVLDIFNLPHTLENMRLILEREDVQLTLKSAINAATREYNKKQIAENEIDQEMPDMSKIQGISPEVMKDFLKRAKEEKIHEESSSFSSADSFTVYTSDTASSTESSKDTPIEDEPETLPDPESATATLEDGLVFCPRCGWDLKVPYKRVEVSEEDKMQFVYSIMHRMPFKKTYGLFQNQMRVTFRSKTVHDSELILEQMRKEDELKMYVNLNHMQYYANLYELVLLLDNIDGPATKPTQKLKPNINDYKNSDNPLRDYMEDICNKYIGTEILFRLISEHFRNFQETYNALVDEALDENFYNPA